MELENTNDIKTELLKRSAKHREELEQEVRLLSDRTERIMTNALIIGGTLAASYFLARLLTRRSRKARKTKAKTVAVLPAAAAKAGADDERDEGPGIVAQIGGILASQAAAFLLGLAKEKLSEYLQSSDDKQVNNDERP